MQWHQLLSARISKISGALTAFLADPLSRWLVRLHDQLLPRVLVSGTLGLCRYYILVLAIVTPFFAVANAYGTGLTDFDMSSVYGTVSCPTA